MRPYAEEVLGALGRRIGLRTNIETFTEVKFKRSPDGRDIRPDGLLIVDTGRTRWTAIIEAKIGTASIGLGQVQRYAELADLNKIDAVITISNQFTAFPSQHPVPEVNELKCGAEIYHVSWMRLWTIATLLTSASEPEFDESQLFLVRELVRFFSHKNIDVHGFHSMTAQWNELISGIKAGKTYKKNDVEAVETVKSWHQEQQDICLILSRNLGVPVRLMLSRKYRDDYLARIEDDAQRLVDARNLAATFCIPNAAGPVNVVADIGTRTIRCSMAVRAPEDRKSHEARLKWLLRQLPDEMPAETYVRVMARGTRSKVALVSGLLDDPSIVKPDNPDVVPTSFEVFVVTDLANRFSGRKAFIQSLENAVPAFYDGIGRHIKEWRPPPPRGPATRNDESLEEAMDRISSSRRPSEKIIKRGTISGRRFAIFENGSIEVETSDGVKWFKDLGSLKNFIDVPG